MIQRCTNPNNSAYKNYGGRIPPINVCKKWLNKKNGFQNFLKDIGNIPEGLTLDRIDNAKDYKPNNWKLSTRKEQQRNTRRNINIPSNGKFLCLKDYCEKLNISYDMVRTRTSRGMSIEEAIITPIKRRKK